MTLSLQLALFCCAVLAYAPTSYSQDPAEFPIKVVDDSPTVAVKGAKVVDIEGCRCLKDAKLTVNSDDVLSLAYDDEAIADPSCANSAEGHLLTISSDGPEGGWASCQVKVDLVVPARVFIDFPTQQLHGRAQLQPWQGLEVKANTAYIRTGQTYEGTEHKLTIENRSSDVRSTALNRRLMKVAPPVMDFKRRGRLQLVVTFKVGLADVRSKEGLTPSIVNLGELVLAGNHGTIFDRREPSQAP